MAPIRDFSLVLRNAGLKSTAPRQGVLLVLSRATAPLRIKDIYAKLQRKEAKIDMVTVYRAIETLSKKGMTRRVDFGEDAAYYEFNDGKDKHHISCTFCKQRKNVEGCFFSEYETRVKAKVPDFEHILRHSIEYFGVCKKCAAKKETIGPASVGDS